MVMLMTEPKETRFEKAANRRRGFVSVDDLTVNIDALLKYAERLKDVRETMRIRGLHQVKIDGVTKFDRMIPEVDIYTQNLRKALIDNDL